MRRHRGGCGRDEYDGRICRQFLSRLTKYLRQSQRYGSAERKKQVRLHFFRGGVSSAKSKLIKNISESKPPCAKSKIPDLPCTTLRPRGESYLRILLQSVAAENVGREEGKTQNKAGRMKRARAKRPEHTNESAPTAMLCGRGGYINRKARGMRPNNGLTRSSCRRA